jgi:2-dehydropantoate 2-reductase
MQYGTYWWPRRKWKTNTDNGNWLHVNLKLLTRQYNGQTAQKRAMDTPQDISLTDILPPIPRTRRSTSAIIPVKIVSTKESRTEETEGGISDAQSVEGLRKHSKDSIINANASTRQTPGHDMDKKAHGTISKREDLEDFGYDLRENIVGDGAPEHRSNGATRSIETPQVPRIEELDEPPTESENLYRDFPISRQRTQESWRSEDEKHSIDHLENEVQPAMNFQERIIAPDPALDMPISNTIHILGTGTVGKFIAHSLAGIPEAPPVTLLMHRPSLMQQWHEEGGTIKLLRNGEINTKSGFNIESSAGFHPTPPGRKFSGVGRNLSSGPQDTIIENLIVTTEGYTTVSALTAIKHRLRYNSTICFIQDGLGVVDHVNSSVFPDPMTRPNYMLGNISHDLQSTENKYTVVEKRTGTIPLTIIPRANQGAQIKKEGLSIRRIDLGWPARSKYLMRTLSRTPELGAVGFRPQEFYRMQLEKLAINSVIGPVSVVYDCFNDQLLYNYQVSRTIKLLLKEISLILRSLPEVSRISSVDKQFSAERLEKLVVSVINKTGKNRTSMLQAVLDGNKTNIDFYNGYLLRRAAELGIDCPRLELIVSMVKGKQNMKSREKNSYIPFADGF